MDSCIAGSVALKGSGADGHSQKRRLTGGLTKRASIGQRAGLYVSATIAKTSFNAYVACCVYLPSFANV